MAKFNPKQVEEINAIIKSVEAELKPGMEIGAKERTSLAGLLQVNKIEKRPKHFKCKAEYSDAIVSYFVKEKGLSQEPFQWQYANVDISYLIACYLEWTKENSELLKIEM